MNVTTCFLYCLSPGNDKRLLHYNCIRTFLFKWLLVISMIIWLCRLQICFNKACTIWALLFHRMALPALTHSPIFSIGSFSACSFSTYSGSSYQLNTLYLLRYRFSPSLNIIGGEYSNKIFYFSLNISMMCLIELALYVPMFIIIKRSVCRWNSAISSLDLQEVKE